MYVNRVFLENVGYSKGCLADKTKEEEEEEKRVCVCERDEGNDAAPTCATCLLAVLVGPDPLAVGTLLAGIMRRLGHAVRFCLVCVSDTKSGCCGGWTGPGSGDG